MRLGKRDAKSKPRPSGELSPFQLATARSGPSPLTLAGIMTLEKQDQSGDRKQWKAPKLRSVVPARRTAGGPFDPGDQDDAFYSTS
jgi:hypothetical protein